jgi:hypothetical protein
MSFLIGMAIRRLDSCAAQDTCSRRYIDLPTLRQMVGKEDTQQGMEQHADLPVDAIVVVRKGALMASHFGSGRVGSLVRISR